MHLTTTPRRASADAEPAVLVVAAAVTGLLAASLLGFVVAAERLAVPALLGIAGTAIGAAIGLRLAAAQQSQFDDGDARAALEHRLALEPPPADRAPAWHPDPLGGPFERLWDGEEWTTHTWRREMASRIPSYRRAALGAVAVLALAGAVMAGAPPAPAQAQAPAGGCPALFHVLHDDRVGSLVLPAGQYRITPFGPRATRCADAPDLLRQFLQDWDGRLPRPWVVDAPGQAFRRGDSGFSVALAAPGTPDSGGGGTHPATGSVCPDLFRVEHDEHIGILRVAAADYRITLLSAGRLSCGRAAALFSQFLLDFDGRLGRAWVSDPFHGVFYKRGNHNLGFRVRAVVPGESGDGAGTHPADGDACPATFRVQHDDRIGRLRLPAGNYRVTAAEVSCTRAAQLFARFLQYPDGRLPSPWSVDAGVGGFRRGGDLAFRVKPAVRGVTLD
jgi:Protein of unknown function (DUF2510)